MKKMDVRKRAFDADARAIKRKACELLAQVNAYEVNGYRDTLRFLLIAKTESELGRLVAKANKRQRHKVGINV